MHNLRQEKKEDLVETIIDLDYANPKSMELLLNYKFRVK